MKRLEKIAIEIFLIIFILAMGFFASRILANGIYQQAANDQAAGIKKIEDEYARKIAKESDANRLVERGVRLLKINLNNMALASLRQATVLEPNFRDAWVYLGFGQLKNNAPEAAIISLKTAEKIDPINPKTYELLKIAYEKTGNSEAAEKAGEKYLFLTKKSGD